MIKLNKLTDYAIAILCRMAEGGRIVTAAELSSVTAVPPPTVAKILKHLAKARLVQAQRGASGGYTLTRPAPEISIAAIITAMDGPIAITECVDGHAGHCQAQSLCPMRGNWDRINRAICAALEAVSLADMMPAPAMACGHQDRGVGKTALPPPQG